MPKKATLTLSGILLLVLGVLFGPEVLQESRDASSGGTPTRDEPPERAEAPASKSSNTSSAVDVDTRVGFTSKRSLEEHYAKHGREFGSISESQYLRLAQVLRDAARGGSVREVVLESVRDDGVITRFDTRSGAFIAFHADKTIRTFFKPNDGLRYFERQLEREHE